ncbi:MULTISPECIES: thioesterase II family protein [unclassified Streptomyces]|uniref:thioesterase II family protein n=1 Tax=unclassified Streptomyces TaxID=2593676 RepID=UPI0036345A5C
MTGQPGASRWLRSFQPAPEAPVRLVCLPHAGGSASFYLPVTRALSPRAEVTAVQYPGRQDRRNETPLADIGLIADRIAAELRTVTDRPYALFGHSMGAIVGFEVARRLEAEGNGPTRLFVSGRRSPLLDRGDEWQPATDDEVISEIRSLDGTHGALLDDAEMRDMILPALRADYAAVRGYRYRPGTPLACPVTAFTGDADRKAPVEAVEAWADLTLGGFGLHVLPGGHFFLVDQQDAVLRTVEEELARTPAPLA